MCNTNRQVRDVHVFDVSMFAYFLNKLSEFELIIGTDV
jgi:hypothetical protein